MPGRGARTFGCSNFNLIFDQRTWKRTLTNVGTWQHPATNAENEKHNIRLRIEGRLDSKRNQCNRNDFELKGPHTEETGEIDKLAGDLDASNDHEEDHKPREDQSDEELPNKASSVLNSRALLQNDLS